MPEYKYVEDGKEFECVKIGSFIIPIKPLEPEEPTHELDAAFLVIAESAKEFISRENRLWVRFFEAFALLAVIHWSLYAADIEWLPTIALVALGVAEALLIKAAWSLAMDWRLRRLAKLFTMFAQHLSSLETRNPADKRIAMAKRLALCMHDAAFDELRRREGLPAGKQG